MPRGIVIRRAEKGEVPALLRLSVEELENELTPAELREGDKAKEEYSRRTKALLDRGGNEFYVATVGEKGETAGFVWLGVSERPFSRMKVGWIYDVLVLPSYRGEGVGEALMRHALGRSRALGFTQTGLMVNSKNKAAWSLYEKLGFKTEFMVMSREEARDSSKS